MQLKSILLNLKYPKLWLLISLIICSFFLFYLPQASELVLLIGSNEYLFIFFAGMLAALGVLTPFCAAILIKYSAQSILLCGLIGGLGAMIVDLIFFIIIKKLFEKDFKNHSKAKQLVEFKGFFANNWVGRKIVNYVSFALAGWIVAAPLPNDMGKKLVAIISKLSIIELAILSFLANTFTITLFLLF